MRDSERMKYQRQIGRVHQGESGQRCMSRARAVEMRSTDCSHPEDSQLRKYRSLACFESDKYTSAGWSNAFCIHRGSGPIVGMVCSWKNSTAYLTFSSTLKRLNGIGAEGAGTMVVAPYFAPLEVLGMKLVVAGTKFSFSTAADTSQITTAAYPSHILSARAHVPQNGRCKSHLTRLAL